ncbi:MAG: alpha/beta fold hydrolase [Bacteriovoracaceae bacterium]|nr:alpha/beta fold hydrolase [Bacteriovoracaceae bacterium]
MKNVPQDLYPWKHHFLGLNGLNLNYVDEGQGPVMLMLHGNPTWSFYYRHLIKAFSGHYRCIVPDHMGCGFSDKPQDYEYTLENHVQNIEKLVKFLDLKDITLVVHDWGGAIGMGFATRHPELIKRVVVLNTAAFLSPDIPKRIAVCKAGAFGEFFVRALNGFAWPATFMTTKKKLPQKVRQAYLAPYDNYANRIAVSRFVQDIPLNESHPSWKTLKEIEEKLPLVKAPKLIVWGGLDFCFNQGFFERWLQIYPEAEAHWIADAGHYVLEDAPRKAIESMAEFFGRTR